MPRFFLNVFNDIDSIDEEGIELADLSAAKAYAARGARSMMADHLIAGRPITLRHRIEIVDASGKVLANIPFGELITIVE